MYKSVFWKRMRLLNQSCIYWARDHVIFIGWPALGLLTNRLDLFLYCHWKYMNLNWELYQVNALFYQVVPEFCGHRCMALLAKMKAIFGVVAVIRLSIWLWFQHIAKEKFILKNFVKLNIPATVELCISWRAERPPWSCHPCRSGHSELDSQLVNSYPWSFEQRGLSFPSWSNSYTCHCIFVSKC
jgi:hypothetical protein